MIRLIRDFFISSILFSLVRSQDCLLTVPDDPLNTGLFKPWFVSTNPISELNCSQLIEGSEVFVEATIYDIDNKVFFVYYPLVIDDKTEPAVKPDSVYLPKKNIVVIHFGINGDTITLKSKNKDNKSLIDGKCVNGLPNGSVFGQFAYCNGVHFFKTVNKDIQNNLLQIPPVLNSNLGDECPTTRSFSIVDQDQSDNVLSQYIVTEDLKIAQDIPANRNNLKVLKIISNGSDNRLLNIFVNPAIGCDSFTAPYLVDNNIQGSSVALNEIQANLIPITKTTALVPPFSPFVVDNNNEQSVLKTNLYRDGVNQPNILIVDNNDNINYCNQMANIAPNFFIKHKIAFLNTKSPAEDLANNLLNFLALRFENSWQELNCKKLIGIPSPIVTTIDPANNMVISNNLLNIGDNNYLTTYISPTRNTILACGNKQTNINCLESCPNGFDNECVTPGFQCLNVENLSINCNIFNFCGQTFDDINCSEPCLMGFDAECITIGSVCFKDTGNICNNNLPNNIQVISENFTDKNFMISSSFNIKFSYIVFFSSFIFIVFLV